MPRKVGLPARKRTTRYSGAELQSDVGAIPKRKIRRNDYCRIGRPFNGRHRYGRATDDATGHPLKHAPPTSQTYFFCPFLPQTPGQSLQSPTTIPVLSAQLSFFVFKHWPSWKQQLMFGAACPSCSGSRAKAGLTVTTKANRVKMTNNFFITIPPL